MKELTRGGQTTADKSRNSKVNSVQEACIKCLAVQVLGFEIFQITRKNEALDP